MIESQYMIDDHWCGTFTLYQPPMKIHNSLSGNKIRATRLRVRLWNTYSIGVSFDYMLVRHGFMLLNCPTQSLRALKQILNRFISEIFSQTSVSIEFVDAKLLRT